MMLPSRTKELMDLHGKIKQSEAKYSAIRDLMAGNFITFWLLLSRMNYINTILVLLTILTEKTKGG